MYESQVQTRDELIKMNRLLLQNTDALISELKDVTREKESFKRRFLLVQELLSKIKNGRL